MLKKTKAKVQNVLTGKQRPEVAIKQYTMSLRNSRCWKDNTFKSNQIT